MSNKKKHIVIIGASSAIAQSVTKEYIDQYTANDFRLTLVARNKSKLDIIGNDLRVRGVTEIRKIVFDFTDVNEMKNFPNTIGKENIDLLFVSYGVLHEQTECDENIRKTLEQIYTNYTSVVLLLTLLVNKIQQHGTIAVVSSVAGDRGRKSNFTYGSSKGGLSLFLEGLRYKLYDKDIHVLTIKPGFVETPMTINIKKGLLWVTPDVIAKHIIKAIQRKKSVLYTPPFWYWIMLIIRNIPVFIFRKLNF